MTECYRAIGYNSTNGTDDVVNNSTTNCTTGTDGTPASSTEVFISAIQGVVGVVMIFANCMVIASIWRMRKTKYFVSFVDGPPCSGRCRRRCADSHSNR